MNSLETLATFFGWATIVNFLILLLSGMSLIAARASVAKIHGKIFGLESADLSRAYFQYLAQFKILIIVFSLTPYVVLKLMQI